MNQRERITFGHGCANRTKFRKADRKIDDIASLATPASQIDHRDAGVARVHRGDEARPAGLDRQGDRGAHQIRLVALHEILGPAERHDHPGKPLRRRARIERRLRLGPAFFRRRRQLAERQHFSRQRQRNFMQARLARPSGEIVHGLGHLQRISGGLAKHFVHIGQKRNRRQTRASGDSHNAFGKFTCTLEVRHERAGAGLHIHH